MLAKPARYTVVFRPVVKQELDEIVKYYEELKPGLGLLFIEVIDLLFKRIEKHPLHFQIKHKSIRRAGLEDFPYNVFFRVHKNQLIILAVLHQRRNPKQWKSRK